MKKLFKLGLFVVGAIVLLAIGAAMTGGGTEEQSTEPTQTEAKEPVSKSTDHNEAKAPEKKVEAKKEFAKVNKANYDKIVQGDSLSGEGGWTEKQVIEMFGKPDNKIESKSGDMVMVDMSWTGKGFSTMSISFMNGKVSSKMWLE